MAQQTQPQSLTFYYDYTVRPGQEAEFMELVKTRTFSSRLMYLRHPNSATNQ